MASPRNLGIESFVVNTGNVDHAIKATVKRYCPDTNTQRNPEEPGYILFFAHGVGFHKEHWEPIIQRLFETERQSHSPFRTLEVWAIDYQSHGHAAVLNKQLFEERPELLPSVKEYGEAFANLYSSGLLGELKKGVQKLVLIGHSAGAIGCIFATTHFTMKDAPFDMLIMIDPTWFGPSGKELSKMYKVLQEKTSSRRYQWSSRDAAYNWMKTRVPWKAWDSRILKIYAEHGLCTAGDCVEGVELVCKPPHETAALYAIPDTDFVNNHLRKICRAIPVHLAFGSRSDLFPREIQDTLHDPHVGHVFKSVTRIEGGGHLIVQEKPDRVSDYLYGILEKERKGGFFGVSPRGRL